MEGKYAWFLGFIGEVEKTNIFSNCKINHDDLLIESIQSKDLFIERRTIKKFLNDKLFVETNDYIKAKAIGTV